MRKIILGVIALMLLVPSALAIDPVAADSMSAALEDEGPGASILDDTVPGTDDIVVQYFYGSGCSHCAMVEPHVEAIAAKYPQVVLNKYETFFNGESQALFYELNTRFGVNNPVVPTIFFEDEALVGPDAIRDNLESVIQRIIDFKGQPPLDDDPGNDTGPPDPNGSGNGTEPPDDGDTGNCTAPSDNGTGSGGFIPAGGLTVAMVVVAALADSINPCAISVMVFLLIFLTALGDRRKVLQIGAVYIVTVYFVYMLAGLGAMTFLHSTAMTRYVYYVAAALSIIIGLINIKDYFFFGKGVTMAIPDSRKPIIKKYVQKASVPAAITLGFAVSLFELPCTGGIYLAILSLLSNEMTMVQGMPYLALYNAIFVLPLAVILVFFLKGVTAEKANEWRLEKRRSLKLILGLVMLLLGAVMIIEVI